MNGAAGIRCFGPTKAAARMEGSKTFSKDFMARHGIPTARFKNFKDYDKAREFLDTVSYNVCIKANGRESSPDPFFPFSSCFAGRRPSLPFSRRVF